MVRFIGEGSTTTGILRMQHDRVVGLGVDFIHDVCGWIRLGGVGGCVKLTVNFIILASP